MFKDIIQKLFHFIDRAIEIFEERKLRRYNIFINYEKWENPLVNALVDLVKQDEGAIRLLMSLPEAKCDPDLNQLS